MIASDRASCFEHGDQGGTFNGNPLMCAAGLAVIEQVSRPEFLAAVAANGGYLADRLASLSRQHGLGPVRGRGLLLAMSLPREIAPDIVAAAFAGGLLLNAPRPDTLRFMPSLTVTPAEIEEMTALLDKALRVCLGKG